MVIKSLSSRRKGVHLRTLHGLTGGILYEFGYDSEGRLGSVVDGSGNVTSIERDGIGNPTAIIAHFGQATQLTVNANGYLSSVTNPAGEGISLTYTSEGLLTSRTDARGNRYTYSYDGLGRFIREDDPAGGSQSLARDWTFYDVARNSTTYNVTHTTALNRVSRYRVEVSRRMTRREWLRLLTVLKL